MPTIQKTIKIFEFIKWHIAANGEAPTFREIGDRFDMRSSGSVAEQLHKMEERGWITKIPNISRGIRLVDRDQKKAA